MRIDQKDDHIQMVPETPEEAFMLGIIFHRYKKFVTAHLPNGQLQYIEIEPNTLLMILSAQNDS